LVTVNVSQVRVVRLPETIHEHLQAAIRTAVRYRLVRRFVGFIFLSQSPGNREPQ